MRRFDKKKNIQKANILAEQRHLESKGLLKEGDGKSGVHLELKSIVKQLYSGLKKSALKVGLFTDNGNTKLIGDDTPQVMVVIMNSNEQEDIRINIDFNIDDENVKKQLIDKISNWPVLKNKVSMGMISNNTLQLEPKKTKSDYMTENPIDELDKATYDSAAEKARAQGMDKLGDKFTTHGQEFGTGGVEINFTDIDGYPLTVKNIEFRGDRKSFDGTVVSDYSEKKHNFHVVLKPNKVVTYWGGDSIVYPSSRKDAKNYLALLNDNGIDTGGIDPRQITYGNVN